jgi:hypothetical protein
VLGFKKDARMTPEEVRRFCKLKYPQLRAETRTNPDGFAFFLGEPRRGVRSNRIIRAVSQNPQSASQLKLAVSSRIGNVERELSFSGGEAELSALINTELALFHAHFGKHE